MPGRIRPTHRLSATTEGEVSCSDDSDCPEGTTCDLESGLCVDGYDTPITRPQDSIGGPVGDPMPVRFHPQGAGIDLGLIRAATGETVSRSPIIEAPPDLATQLDEGDTVALESIPSRENDYAGLEATAVIEVYGPQKARPKKTLVETQDV